MKSDKQAFFRIRDGEWFVGNDGARGPWSADACHAGPVTGLIARALEGTVTDKQLVRITTDYARPIPLSGFRIDTEITRNGRAAATAAATLIDVDGNLGMTAGNAMIEWLDPFTQQRYQSGLHSFLGNVEADVRTGH